MSSSKLHRAAASLETLGSIDTEVMALLAGRDGAASPFVLRTVGEYLQPSHPANPLPRHLCRYGQHQWAGYDCKFFRKGRPGGAPAAWVLSTPCALKWSRPLIQANVGFLFLTPAVAALAAIAVMGLRQHKRLSAGSGSRVQEAAATVRSWGSSLLPPK